MQVSRIFELDKTTKEELDKKLLQGGFKDYRGLAEWLQEKGFEFSKSSIARYGKNLKRKTESINLAIEQAQALCKNIPNEEGALNKALLYLLQERLFSVLLDVEEIKLDPKKVDLTKLGRMISDLSRASVSAEKYSKEVKNRAEEAIKEVEKTKGLSKDAAEQIKRKIMGIP